jgi:hypothetical protein
VPFPVVGSFFTCSSMRDNRWEFALLFKTFPFLAFDHILMVELIHPKLSAHGD